MDFTPEFVDGLATIITAAVVFVATFLARLLGLNIQARHREVLDAAVRTAALALIPRLLATLSDKPIDDVTTTRAERRVERALLHGGVLDPDNPDVRAAVNYVETTGAPTALKSLAGSSAGKRREVVMEKLTAAVVAEMKVVA